MRGLLKGERAGDGGRHETTSRDRKSSRSNPRVYNLGLGAEQRPDVLPAGRFRSEKRNFGGDARSPVDCIKRRVPSRAEDASFFSAGKEASTTKTKRASTQAADRRDSCTTTREGGGSETETRGRREPDVFRIMKDARLSGSNVHST